MGERNLVIEGFGQPRGGSSAVIVYAEPVFRGRGVYLLAERDDWLELIRLGIERPVRWQQAYAANVVRRLVNGEETFCAWFPRVGAGEYVVATAAYLLVGYTPQLNEFYAEVTAFPGEVAEVDLRADI